MVLKLVRYLPKKLKLKKDEIVLKTTSNRDKKIISTVLRVEEIKCPILELNEENRMT